MCGLSPYSPQAREHLLSTCGAWLSCSAACGFWPAQGLSHVSCIGRRSLYQWAARGSPVLLLLNVPFGYHADPVSQFFHICEYIQLCVCVCVWLLSALLEAQSECLVDGPCCLPAYRSGWPPGSGWVTRLGEWSSQAASRGSPLRTAIWLFLWGQAHPCQMLFSSSENSFLV